MRIQSAFEEAGNQLAKAPASMHSIMRWPAAMV
jgi:hypothetical protein